MNPSDADEIHGRLSLWIFTLLECEGHLKFAAKANAANTPEKLELQQERMRGLEDLGPKNAPPTPGDPLGFNKYQRFNHDHPEYYAFPTYHDLREVIENAQMLAIIAFCRIWNSGRGAPGKAKSNSDAAVAPYREKMVNEAFPDPAERSSFKVFREQVIQARDKILAHADASHSNFPISTGGGIRLPANAVYQIDMEYFAICIERLLSRCRVFAVYE